MVILPFAMSYQRLNHLKVTTWCARSGPATDQEEKAQASRLQNRSAPKEI